MHGAREREQHACCSMVTLHSFWLVCHAVTRYRAHTWGCISHARIYDYRIAHLGPTHTTHTTHCGHTHTHTRTPCTGPLQYTHIVPHTATTTARTLRDAYCWIHTMRSRIRAYHTPPYRCRLRCWVHRAQHIHRRTALRTTRATTLSALTFTAHTLVGSFHYRTRTTLPLRDAVQHLTCRYTPPLLPTHAYCYAYHWIC